LAAKLSRRYFLKSCAIVAGGIVGATIATEVATPLIFPEELVFDENTSLWSGTQPPRNPPLREDIDVDVAIIGGGYTGLSAAYYLLQHFPGKNIAVFEARGVGQGASGRNGGMLLPQTANEYMQVYSDPQTHKRIYDVTVQNMDDLDQLVQSQNMDYDLRRKGVLLVIAKESQVEQYRQYAAQAQSLGMPIEFWDRARTQDEIGTQVYYSSLFDPNAGEVHPMKLVHALKKAAEAAGADIYEDSPVRELEEGETVRLTVGEANHKVNARAVVLATNGYTSKLGFFQNSVVPIHTPMAVTTPLPESTFTSIGWNNKVGYSDTYTLLYHLSRTPDSRILIGSGYVNYFFNNGIINKDDPNFLKAHLYKELIRIYPGLSGIDFEYVWTGVLGFSIDFSQSVGVMGAHKNIYYGLCYVGHGINLATLFGKIIADIYAGEASKWKDFPFFNHHFIPLPPEPLKWVALHSARAYFRMADEAK
jgi:glycine/D-amino acid oxidase-like deaminating enzyme